MKGIERILATIKGEESDRRACSLTTSLLGASLIGCDLKNYYNNSEVYLNGQMAVAEKCCTDIIFSPFAFPIFAEAAGAKIRYLESNPPNVSDYLDYNPEKGHFFNLESIIDSPILNNYMDTISKLSEQFNEKAVAAINISPCDLPAMTFGVDKWLHTLLFYPNVAKQILTQLSEYFILSTNTMFRKGATAVVTTINFSNNSIVTQKIRDEIVLPILKECFQKISGPIIIHHGGPDFNDNLTQYEQLPNNIGYVISPRDRFANCRKQISSKKLLIGNYDGPLLKYDKKEKISQKVIRVLQENLNDKHFIFGSSNADIAYDTSLDKLKIIEENLNNF